MLHKLRHRMLCCGLVARVALVVALSAALSAVPAAQAQTAARKPAAETPLATCAAANRQALLDLGQAIDAAARRNVASPMVVARLQGAKAQAAKLRDGLPAAQRTLADCEAAAATIASEKERLIRIAGADPETTDCVAANQRTHTALLQGHDAAQRAGVPPDQAPALQASGARLGELGMALASGNLLLADCRQLGVRLAQERTAIERWMSAGSAAVPMASTSMPAAPTVQTVQATPSPAPAPATAGLVPPAAPASTGAATAAPAAAMATAAAAAAAAPASPEACRETQTTQYNQVAQAFASVAQTGAMPPDKVLLFQSLSDRLTQLRGLIADRNAAGWDCAGVLQGLQQVRTALQPLVAAPAAPVAPAAAPVRKR